MSYPKEYQVYVCPPVSSDDAMYPEYDCKDTSVHAEPGQCPTCEKPLQLTSVSDVDFYLATYELQA